jgi:hypothetical protein
MMRLSQVLQAEPPPDLSPRSIEDLAARLGCADCLEDAWGGRLRVDRVELKGGREEFEIRSFGANGEPGVRRFFGIQFKWDTDVILRGDNWVEVW